MKLIRTKAWWLARADREGDAMVGAGVAALYPRDDEIVQAVAASVSQPTQEEKTQGLGPKAADVRGEGRLRGKGASITGSSTVDDTRIAFGRFVEFMRRGLGLSIEQLAERADLEAAELIRIEDDLHYTPELRTVYQLAQTFEVKQQRLLQLAGLTQGGDARLRRDAVRFAARSESVQKLSEAELAALREFVAALSSQDE